MLNFYRLFKNGLGATLVYFKRNKTQNNLIIMSKIAPKHLDVGPDRRTDGRRGATHYTSRFFFQTGV